MARFKRLIIGFILCFLTCVLSAIGALAFAETTDSEFVSVQTIVGEMFGDRNVKSVECLYNFNDSPDYVCVSFENKGYAIYLEDTLELLEYSPTGSLPYNDTDERKYYAGPTNYYIKDNDSFKSATSEDSISYTDALSINTEESSQTPASAPNIDKNDLIPSNAPGMAYGVYIKNANFFSAHPYHGDNKHGTCGSVAAQIMLNFNNYYNDRRIIPNQYLNGGWKYVYDEADIYDINNYDYPELNPNACLDPNLLNVRTAGSNDLYYKYLIMYIEQSAFWCVCTHETTTINNGITTVTTVKIHPDGHEEFVSEESHPTKPTDKDGEVKIEHTHEGSTIDELKKGLKDVLGERLSSSGYTINSDYKYSGKINSEPIKKEINEDRPVIISMAKKLGGLDHWVVGYGYQSYTYPSDSANAGQTYSGYIVDMGWGSSDSSVWINESWCDAYISLKINHTHTYEYVEKDSHNMYNEYRCTVCGHRDGIYETNEEGNTITGLKHPPEGYYTNIPARINNIPITKIGGRVFEGSDVIFVTFEDYSMVREFGSAVFHNCKSLALTRLPDNLESTGVYAFRGCNPVSITYFGNSLKTIDRGAFRDTPFTKFDLPASVQTIADWAYQNTSLKGYSLPNGSQLSSIGPRAFSENAEFSRFMLPSTVVSIGSEAFTGCSSLTLYTEHSSQPSGWNSNWNDGNRPVIWGCTFRDGNDYQYVYSVNKTSTSISNANAANGINNPTRQNYTFGGWYTTADFSGTQYMDITTAPNGTLYAKWSEQTSSCVAEGSMITLADGSQKAVEELDGSEQLLVWNLMTGDFDTAPILFVDSEARAEFDVINLHFSDGTAVKVISEHAFWDFDLNKYVYLREDADKYIGHWFNKQTTDTNGNLSWTKIQLESVTIQKEITTAWSPVTYGHLCYYVNGMLSIPGGIEGLFNVFEVNSETMQIKQEEYLADIEEYGLFTYEEFAEILPIPEAIFEAAGCRYFKVAMGKGILIWDKLRALVERYSKFF